MTEFERDKPNEHVKRVIKQPYFGKGFNTAIGKKTLRIHQGNEYTRVSKNFEGLCYACFRRDYVMPTVVDVCYKCAAKRGNEPILAIVVKKMHGYCFLHGGYSGLEKLHNIAQLNVRICMKCAKRIQMADITKAKKPDPLWTFARRRLGKDFKQLMGLPPHFRI